MKTRPEQVIELLWDSLPPVKGRSDWRQTGWGPKSQEGLIASIQSICDDDSEETIKEPPCRTPLTRSNEHMNKQEAH